MKAFMKTFLCLLFSAMLTTTVLGEGDVGCLATTLMRLPECVAMQQNATGSGGDLESFCYTPCYNSIFNAYDGCGFTDANPVAGCVSIITTVMPGNAATLSVLSLTTLLVALTVSVTF